MSTLLEIEAATEALPQEQKAELLRFLAARLRSARRSSPKNPSGAARGRYLVGSAARCAADDAGKCPAHAGRLAVSWLLDVNVVLASRWTTHSDHLAARAGQTAQVEAATLDETLISKPWAAGVAENPLSSDH